MYPPEPRNMSTKEVGRMEYLWASEGMEEEMRREGEGKVFIEGGFWGGELRVVEFERES